MKRTQLSELAGNHDKVRSLLSAMKAESKEVKPHGLGVIGKDHLRATLSQMGCSAESLAYKKVAAKSADGLPFVIETAFGYLGGSEHRKLITGVNWSPGILNPFRQLGGNTGLALDSILGQNHTDEREPIVLVIHGCCPRVNYTDRGKSSVETT
jgi:DNA topoisomerase VI subunit B